MSYDEYLGKLKSLLIQIEKNTGCQIQSISCQWIDTSIVGKSKGILKEIMVTHLNPADRIVDPI